MIWSRPQPNMIAVLKKEKKWRKDCQRNIFIKSNPVLPWDQPSRKLRRSYLCYVTFEFTLFFFSLYSSMILLGIFSSKPLFKIIIFESKLLKESPFYPDYYGIQLCFLIHKKNYIYALNISEGVVSFRLTSYLIRVYLFFVKFDASRAVSPYIYDSLIPATWVR